MGGEARSKLFVFGAASTTTPSRAQRMRLFTKTDIERAARLALLHFMAPGCQGDPERAISSAVSGVTDDAPLYYSEEEVRQLLQFALQRDDIEADFRNGLRAIGRD